MDFKEFSEKTQALNEKGIANLREQGVDLPPNAVTEDIIDSILEIVSSGGGVQYNSIVYNNKGGTEDTVTLIDTEGIEHTMICRYEDEKLVYVNYDGKSIRITYEGDKLVKIGRTVIDVSNAPLDGEDYTEVYKLMSRNPPTEDVENEIINFVGLLLGVSE